MTRDISDAAVPALPSGGRAETSGYAATLWEPLDRAAGERKTPPAAHLATNLAPWIRNERPFFEIWDTFLRPARHRLAAEAGAVLAAFADAAVDDCARRLLLDVAALAEPAVWESFAAFRRERWERTPGRGGAYADFRHRMLADGLGAFFGSYPVLDRQVPLLIETWLAATGEMARRLAADREEIARTFNAGGDPGPVTAVQPGLSDRHHGGRQVAILTFASGLQLVYKPRDVALDAAFYGWLRWAAAAGLDPCPPAPLLLARSGYGWMERIVQSPAADGEGVRRYWRTAGSLVCLAYALRGRDLHMDNVIATPAGPVLIDAEMLLSPPESADVAGVARGAVGRAAGRVRDSCLGSGLLTFLDTAADGAVHEIGGLRGAGGWTVAEPQRRWRGIGSDDLGFTLEPAAVPPAQNLLLLDGEPQRAEEHAAEIVAGLAATYRFLLARRREILAPGGPLAAFAGCRVRVVFRPSGVYAALQRRLATPRWQRSGTARSQALEALSGGFPLAAVERAAFERLDIPHFAIAACGRSVRTPDGREVPGLFARSGLMAVIDRLRGLCAEDLDEQTEILEAVLSSATTAHDLDGRLEATGVALAGDAPGTAAFPQETCLRRALAIGERLLRRAVRGDDGGLTWIAPAWLRLEERADRGVSYYLYDGAVGIALFLAALRRATGDPAWGEAALAACRPVTAALASRDLAALAAHEGIGVCNGLGSLIYGLVWTGWLLGSEEALAAESAARLLTSDRIARDRRLDIEGGAAGAILALLALHAARPADEWLDRALACGRHLLAARTSGENAGWPGHDGVARAGFAHGAAGIGYALARLAAATQEEAFLAAAHAACRFERGLFVAAAGNWPVLAAGPDGKAAFFTTWCHGAPGIGLARALTLELLDGEARREAETAFATTMAAPPAAVDHLCCGNLGRAGVLLTAGEHLGRPDLVAAARGIAERSLRGAAAAGVFQPGFFKGLAGIGYELLRLASAARLPSVLAFEAPAGGVR